MRPDVVPREVTLSLGSWGFPAEGAVVTELSSPEGLLPAKAICLRKECADGRVLQMAMTIAGGWDHMEVKEWRGANPLWDSTLLISSFHYIYGDRRIPVPCLITQLISRETGEDFTSAELFPISAAESDGEITILHFRDGSTRFIDFGEKEGRLSL